ncbi:NADH-quinone oxidoreductase subunit H [Escherichia coli]|nr:NADH-quinone oxidoreductase subunit H [Escherichia coli]
MRQTLCDGYLVIFALAQAVILLMLTPLFTGISRQIRARMHSRRGPGIWQDYRDIHKLFKRQEVAPTSSGLMFRLMPWVLISSMLVLAMGWNSPLTTVLALLACGFACFIEMGKIPFDVAEAEQELQEGPLTEYSGAGLALAKWGLGLKQVVMASLFVALFLPFGRAQELSLACLLTSLVVTLLKVLLIFVLASIAENTLARGRFLLIHHVTWLGFSLAALAWVFWLTGL